VDLAPLATGNKLIFKDEIFAIQGAIFEVNRVMGFGFLEAVYQECLQKEFLYRNIPFAAQETLALTYKGETLQQIYKPDFICYGKIIIELKVAKEIGNDHRAQLFNYLKVTNFKLGLLVNFGHYPKAEFERIVI
jgi:GxxExxY protein